MNAVLAGASGVLLVAAAWEALGALVRPRLLDQLGALLGPARAAGRDGRAAGIDERRRLVAVSVVTLSAGGWLAAGPLAALLLAASGPALSALLVRLRRSRWQRQVARGAAPAARALADALSAGYALPRAISAAATDGAVTGPARSLLAEAAAALALGEPVAGVLERTTRRAGGGPWGSIAAAALVQRETGGDLALLLRDLAAGIELGERVDAHARSASAQARLTARIVLALPVFGLALAEVAAPSVLAQMLAYPPALMLVVGAVVLQAIALVAMARITRALG